MSIESDHAAPQKPTEAQAPRRIPWRALLLLVVATSVVVIGLGAAALVSGNLRLWLKDVVRATLRTGPSYEEELLQQRAMALEARLGDINEKLARIELKPAPPVPGLADLRDRLAALEAKPAAASAPLPRDLLSRLGQLEAALAEARRPVADAGPPATDQTAHLERLEQAVARQQVTLEGLARAPAPQQELARLTARVEELGREHAGTDVAARRQSIVLVLAQLREAAREGRPFAAELKALVAIVGAEADWQAASAGLVPFAEAGAPTLRALQAEFVSAAELALGGAVPQDADWRERALDRISRLITIRRVGEVQGDTPEAALARAEVRLAGGDLGGAVEALGKLQGKPAEAIAAWRNGAERRLELNRRLALVERRALAIAGSN